MRELLISSGKPRENSETITELEKFSAQVSWQSKPGFGSFKSCFNRLIRLGAFGEVRMCVHRESQAQRAVKVLRKSHMDEEEKRMLFNEINILKEIDHPNIVKMYEFFEDDKRYYLVTEICKGGELFDEIL